MNDKVSFLDWSACTQDVRNEQRRKVCNLPSKDRSLPVTEELKCRGMSLSRYHDSILRHGAHVARARARRCCDVTLATEPSIHVSKARERRTALNQTFIIIDIPCQSVDLPREATPLSHCRFEGNTKLSHHTWTLKRGFSSAVCDKSCLEREGERRSSRSQRQQLILR